MKKITIIFTTAAMLMGFAASAQTTNEDAREKLIFGLKAGANLANVYDEEGEDFTADPKLGFAGGAFISIPIGPYLGIQPEVLFSQKGFSATGNALGSRYEFTRTSNFVDVPVFFALKPAGFITILAGPQFSYLFQQNDKFDNGYGSVEQKQEFENEDIRNTTVGFVGGVDININHFVVGARAGWDVMKNRSDGTSSTPRYKNAWFQGTIGFRFY